MEQEEESTSTVMVGSVIPASSQQYVSQVNISQPDYEPEEEVGLELPPPMKPIQEPCVISNGPPALQENPVTLVSGFKK